MLSRQRFLKTMRFGTPDRVPYLEEGIRDNVLETWRTQGLGPDGDLSKLFLTDQRIEIDPDLFPHLEIERWPTSCKELEDFQRHLDPSDPKRLPADWSKQVRIMRTGDSIRMLRVHCGFFESLGVGDWQRLSDVIYLLKDDPGFVIELMTIQGKFTAKVAARVLEDIEVDAAIFSEPIAGNQGPLISPQMYEKFVLKSYEPLLDILRDNCVDIIIFRTYANARILIPSVLQWGFNCLWAHEVDAIAMDYRDLRSAYGHDLRLIGGIDLDALRYGKDSIQREIEQKVPPLLAQGGYVPMLDGRVREDVSFENYAYYRRLLEQATKI